MCRDGTCCCEKEERTANDSAVHDGRLDVDVHRANDRGAERVSDKARRQEEGLSTTTITKHRKQRKQREGGNPYLGATNASGAIHGCFSYRFITARCLETGGRRIKKKRNKPNGERQNKKVCVCVHRRLDTVRQPDTHRVPQQMKNRLTDTESISTHT